MMEKNVTVPSKGTKVVKNNNWSESEEPVNVEQCTENSNVIHGTISSPVAVLAD